MILRDLVRQRIGVWGRGLEANAVLRRLQGLEAQEVTVFEDRKGMHGRPPGLATVDHFRIVTGEADSREVLRSVDVVIASPGIPPTSPLWKDLATLDIPVMTTVDLWMAEYGHRAIGITGSKGKSTTSALTAHIAGTTIDGVALGGNIGVDFFDLPSDASWYVVEVGSPQAARLHHSPRLGAITALFPEHLDWHGSADRYFDAKANLFNHGSLSVHGPSRVLELLAPRLRGPEPVPVDGVADVGPAGTLVLEGHETESKMAPVLQSPQNLSNLSVACSLTRAMGVDLGSDPVLRAIESFRGLPHRLESIGTVDAVEWIDDSLATSAEPVIAALDAFNDRHVVLILGGLDRGLDYGALALRVLSHNARISLISIPDNGANIIQRIRAAGFSGRAIDTTSISDAAEAARVLADPGSVVLFSPAAASGSAHPGYWARSSEFREAVRRLSS